MSLIVGSLFVILSGGYWLFTSIDFRALSAFNPMGDSPNAIVRDFFALTDDFTRSFDSIENSDDIPAAIARIKELENRCKALEARVIGVGPLTKDQHIALRTVYSQQIPSRREELKTAMAQLRDKNIATPELLGALAEFQFAVMDATSSMELAWQEIPEPNNELEELQFAHIAALRQLWKSTAAIETKSVQALLSSAYQDAATEIQALATKKRTLCENETFKRLLEQQTVSPYFSLQVRFSIEVSSELADLFDAESVPLEIQQVVQKFSEANANFSNAGTTHDAFASPSMANRGPMQQPPGVYRTQQPGGQHGFPRPNFPGPDFPEPGRGTRTLSRPTGNPAQDAFIMRYGEENVVRVHVTNTTGSKAQELGKKLRESVGSTAMRWSPSGTEIWFAIKYPGPPSDIAGKIDWGEVQLTDEQTRTIEVVATASEN
ncbi:MAG: hypothetical protein R3C53_18845 [Pirellulaceae bacterium]